MNFKNFSQAQFSKLRNGINGVGDFQYDTICSQNFVSIENVLEIVRGGAKFYTHRHTHARTHTHRKTHTHTETPTHRNTHTL